jgi:hypothetical protein
MAAVGVGDHGDRRVRVGARRKVKFRSCRHRFGHDDPIDV